MMQSKKTAKAATFELLDKMASGSIFTGSALQRNVRLETGEYHYPATILRYMREWREIAQREVVCTNKAKSMYQVMS
jgi:hypothetical protein